MSNSNQSDSNEHLDAELQYYKQQIKDLSAHTIKQDAKISSLQQQLKKKERGFRLLSKLQTFIGQELETENLFRETLKELNAGLNMDVSLIAHKQKGIQSFQLITALGKDIQEIEAKKTFDLKIETDLWEKKYLLVNSETKRNPTIEKVTEITGIPYFISVPFQSGDQLYYIICGRKKERVPFSLQLDERDVETVQSIVLFLSEHLEAKRD